MPVRAGREIKGPQITGGNPDTANDAPVTTTTVGATYDLSGQLGAIYRTPDGLKEWLYVQFSTTSTGKAPSSNQICFFVTNSTSNLAAGNAWVVDNNTTANSGVDRSRPAGILRNACTRGNYVWLLRRAPSCNVVSTATGAGIFIGAPVLVGTSSGEAVAASTSTSVPAAGFATTPWFVGVGQIGWVNSTTTVGVALDTVLSIE